PGNRGSDRTCGAAPWWKSESVAVAGDGDSSGDAVPGTGRARGIVPARPGLSRVASEAGTNEHRAAAFGREIHSDFADAARRHSHQSRRARDSAGLAQLFSLM